jgi:hypothetical protein
MEDGRLARPAGQDGRPPLKRKDQGSEQGCGELLELIVTSAITLVLQAVP